MVVKRGVNTHRIVCEPPQNDRSGKGIARRRSRVTARSDPRPPSAPAHTRSKGLKGKRPREEQCASSTVQGTALGTGFREVWPRRRAQVPLHELGVAEVGPALHSAVLLLRHGRRRPQPGPPPADKAAQLAGRPAALPAPPRPARRRSPPSVGILPGAPGGNRQRPEREPQKRPRPQRHEPAAERHAGSAAVKLRTGWGAASFGPEGGGASGGGARVAPRAATGSCAAEAPPSARQSRLRGWGGGPDSK